MANIGDIFRDLGFDVPKNEEAKSPVQRFQQAAAEGSAATDSLLLPRDSRSVLKALGRQGKQSVNLALLLNKYSAELEGEKIKKLRVPVVSEELQELLEQLNRLYADLKDVQELSLATASRMVVGLGGATVYETGMTFHHVYGCPYIPGSAVKGMCRHWIIQEHFGNQEDNALRSEEFRKAFGFQEGEKSGRGEVIFFDAFPAELKRLELDIMNPHFSEYYTKAGYVLPTDDQRLIPVTFLTVPKGTKLRFVLQGGRIQICGNSITEHLQEALTESGIGAKNALGYGLFVA